MLQSTVQRYIGSPRSNLAMPSISVLSQDNTKLWVYLLNKRDFHVSVQINTDSFEIDNAQTVSLIAPGLNVWSDNYELQNEDVNCQSLSVYVTVPPYSLTRVTISK